jgi:hypothetical protein
MLPSRMFFGRPRHFSRLTPPFPAPSGLAPPSSTYVIRNSRCLADDHGQVHSRAPVESAGLPVPEMARSSNEPPSKALSAVRGQMESRLSVIPCRMNTYEKGGGGSGRLRDDHVSRRPAIKSFRLISLHKNTGQAPWNDIVTKNRGGRVFNRNFNPLPAWR